MNNDINLQSPANFNLSVEAGTVQTQQPLENQGAETTSVSAKSEFGLGATQSTITAADNTKVGHHHSGHAVPQNSNSPVLPDDPFSDSVSTNTSVAASASDQTETPASNKGNPCLAPNPFVALVNVLASFTRMANQEQYTESQLNRQGMQNDVKLGKDMAATDISLGLANAASSVMDGLSSLTSGIVGVLSAAASAASNHKNAIKQVNQNTEAADNKLTNITNNFRGNKDPVGEESELKGLQTNRLTATELANLKKVDPDTHKAYTEANESHEYLKSPQGRQTAINNAEGTIRDLASSRNQLLSATFQAGFSFAKAGIQVQQGNLQAQKDILQTDQSIQGKVNELASQAATNAGQQIQTALQMIQNMSQSNAHAFSMRG